MEHAIRTVKIRSYHLNDVRKFYLKRLNAGDASVVDMVSLLTKLYDEQCSSQEKSVTYIRFVDSKSTEEVIPFFSITPDLLNKFIYHLLLSMGAFDTELDFMGLTMLQCLEKAKLIPSAARATIHDADALSRKYILE